MGAPAGLRHSPARRGHKGFWSATGRPGPQNLKWEPFAEHSGNSSKMKQGKPSQTDKSRQTPLPNPLSHSTSQEPQHSHPKHSPRMIVSFEGQSSRRSTLCPFRTLYRQRSVPRATHFLFSTRQPSRYEYDIFNDYLKPYLTRKHGQ